MTPAAIRDYTRGLRTQAEVARELGLSTRQLQRIEDEALAVWLLGIARAMREAIGDREGTPQIPRRFACRISEIEIDDVEHVSGAASPRLRRLSSGPVSGVDERPRLLIPRRFGAKP